MVEIGQVIQKKTIFKFCQFILLIGNYFPLEKSEALLNTLKPIHLRMLCAKFGLKLARWFWRRFQISSMFVRYFCYYLPLEKGVAFHLNDLESLSPKNALYQVKLVPWFWRRTFFKLCPCILLFCDYPPLKNLLVLHLNKLESPSPKDALSLVWLKLAQWFWRSRFLNFLNAFLLFHHYLPLEKGVALHLTNFHQFHPTMLRAKFGWNWPVVLEKKFLKNFINVLLLLSPLGKERGGLFYQTWIPFSQGYFVPSLVEIGPVVLDRRFKCNKRPMGHIAHLRNQFKSISTYIYIITLIKRRKKLTLW